MTAANGLPAEGCCCWLFLPCQLLNLIPWAQAAFSIFSFLGSAPVVSSNFCQCFLSTAKQLLCWGVRFCMTPFAPSLLAQCTGLSVSNDADTVSLAPLRVTQERGMLLFPPWNTSMLLPLRAPSRCGLQPYCLALCFADIAVMVLRLMFLVL